MKQSTAVNLLARANGVTVPSMRKHVQVEALKLLVEKEPVKPNHELIAAFYHQLGIANKYSTFGDEYGDRTKLRAHARKTILSWIAYPDASRPVKQQPLTRDEARVLQNIVTSSIDHPVSRGTASEWLKKELHMHPRTVGGVVAGLSKRGLINVTKEASYKVLTIKDWATSLVLLHESA